MDTNTVTNPKRHPELVEGKAKKPDMEALKKSVEKKKQAIAENKIILK